METTKHTYLNVAGFDNAPMVRLNDMESFVSLVEKHNPDTIFVSSEKEAVKADEKDIIGRIRSVKKTITLFAFYHNGIVYSVDSKGFKSLEAYTDGCDKGYATGDDFHLANEGNFVDAEEFNSSKNAGFDANRVDFLKAKSLGFENSAQKIEQAYIEGKIADKEYKKIKDLKKDSEIYSMALGQGYENYEEFENALSSGFVKANAAEFRTAQNMGFEDSDAYFKAKTGSFEDPSEFSIANSLGITDKGEFEKYKELNAIKTQYGFRTLEQANAFILLAEMAEGRKLSVARIWDMLKEAEKEVKFVGGTDKKWFDRPILQLFNSKRSPSWYTSSFKDIIELKVFLISNDNVGKIGLYDADGEVFERKTSAEQSVSATNGESVVTEEA